MTLRTGPALVCSLARHGSACGCVHMQLHVNDVTATRGSPATSWQMPCRRPRRKNEDVACS